MRRVLTSLKARGLITQAVGSGTFVLPGAAASAPAAAAGAPVQTRDLIQTSPAELMEARLLIEPLMPRLIVRYATAADFLTMVECLDRSEAAASIDEESDAPEDGDAETTEKESTD